MRKPFSDGDLLAIMNALETAEREDPDGKLIEVLAAELALAREILRKNDLLEEFEDYVLSSSSEPA